MESRTHLLVYVFSVVFFFAFRESVKLAAVWRAFHGWPDPRQTVTEFWLTSVPILLLMPLIYFVGARRLLSHILLRAGTADAIWIDLFFISGAALMGLFPRAVKNLWALIAGWQSSWARRQGQAERAWIDVDIASGRGGVPPLPARSYSSEAVFFLGVIPALAVVVLVKMFGVSALSPDIKDLTELLIAIYSAQIVVLWYANKTRGFVYKETQPAHLV